MNLSGFYLLFVAWVISVVATLGSLFFSEVVGYQPCSLCWYQRICMYPLVFIFAVGSFPVDRKVLKFSSPLVLTGWFLSFYHNLLHWEIIPETAAPCRQGIPCSTKYIEWMGFITIPLMSFVAFSAILGLLFFFYKTPNGDHLHE